MTRCMQIMVALACFTVLAETEQPLRPTVVLSGSDSAVQKGECQRITRESDWKALWDRHVAQLQRMKTERPMTPAPQVDFEKCMVIAILAGSTWNTEGLRFVTSTEKEDEVVLGLDWLTYQSEGEGDKVTPYGFLVLPRTAKALRIQFDIRDLGERADNAPPNWKDCQIFPAIEPQK